MATTNTAIQWTDRTWNPTRGCSLVSPGCTNCYAMKQGHRFHGPGQAYEGATRLTAHGPIWTGKVWLVEGLLEQPLRWRKPLRIFVNSMGDLFHETLAPIDILHVFDVMLRANWHVFQILTKRGGRVRELSGQLRWAPHIWMGVSVENADYGDRIDELRATGAQIKFLSLEPLLGPLEHLDLGGIDWIIVGGESGPGARPMKLEWARSIIRQCRAAGVACFVKQLGAKPIDRDAPLQLSDRKGGDLQEWPPDLRVREFPGALAEKGAL